MELIVSVAKKIRAITGTLFSRFLELIHKMGIEQDFGGESVISAVSILTIEDILKESVGEIGFIKALDYKKRLKECYKHLGDYNVSKPYKWEITTKRWSFWGLIKSKKRYYRVFDTPSYSTAMIKFASTINNCQKGR